MNLDEFLSQPIPPVADDGFSARVMSQVRAEERLRIIAYVAGAVVMATLLCVLLPLQAMTVEVNTILVQLAESTTVCLAAGAIVLTLLLERQFARF